MAFGLTTEGFVPPTLADLRESVNARIRSTISTTMDLSDRSLEGQLIGIVCEALIKGWEIAEAVNSSMDPDKAVDAALDALCVLTGTFRRGASASAVVLALTGTPTSVIPAGSGARVPDSTRFDTNDIATIVAANAWVALTAYIVGERVTKVGNIYEASVAGTTAASPGPSGTDPITVEVDGTVSWRYLGEGTGVVDALATATSTGPSFANSGTITEIATPVGGWAGVNNVLDATVGRNQMNNAELRVLRQLELAQPGTSPADAVRAAILSLDDVTACTVFVNNSDTTDGDGVPPHSVEVMVQGGDDQDIWDALFANVAAGVLTHGSEDGTAADSQGTDHAMAFTRVDEVEIYVGLTLVVDPLTYPADGNTQVKEAVVDYGDAQIPGRDAVASRIGAAAFDVPGVLDVVCLISLTPTPTLGTTLTISLRQLATFDTSRITVATSDGTP